MTKQTFRNAQALMAFITLMALLVSFYLQYGLGMQPCPLCFMQRFMVIGLLFLGLSALYVSTLLRARVLLILQCVVALAGLYFAARQLWLQNLPEDQAATCLPDLGILMKYFPWQDTVKALFLGSSDCAEIHATLFGLTLPAWTGLYFLFIFMMGLVVQHKVRD